MQLIDNWRQLFRFYSVIFMAAAAGVQGAWASFPAEWRDVLPTWIAPAVSIVLLVLGILGRVLKQTSLATDDG